eukprot:1160017-Pelagomonas_calceolata.AAC.3
MPLSGCAAAATQPTHTQKRVLWHRTSWVLGNHALKKIARNGLHQSSPVASDHRYSNVHVAANRDLLAICMSEAQSIVPSGCSSCSCMLKILVPVSDCCHSMQLHAKIRDVAAGKTDKATRESSLPPLARTSSGKPSLLSMGTLGRSKTLKGLLGLHDERGESTAQRALQEYETEELKRRDSGGSSSLATTSK